MGVMAVLAVLLLFTATVKANGGVTFWREEFTMTCPEEGIFYKDGGNITVAVQHVTLKYVGDKKGLYHCDYDDGNRKYYFYVKGKVCESCYELDPYLLGLVIIVDVTATALIMFTIFKCTKKKNSAGLTYASKAPAHSGGMNPPTNQPTTYEPLNPHTRAQDTYSGVKNRTR